MTIAQAIAEIRNGNTDGFRDIVFHTAPGIWLAVSLLCGSKTGRVMAEIYQEAWENKTSLKSPSDLRIWLCSIAYPMIESHLDVSAEMTGDDEQSKFYKILTELPRDERIAVLLLCSEGCTASQAEEICGRAEIEIKRAMRRARASIAQKAVFAGQTINTAWITDNMQKLRQEASKNDELYNRVYECAVNGTLFEEKQINIAETDKNNSMPENAEDGHSGFFSRLFRTKRF